MTKPLCPPAGPELTQLSIERTRQHIRDVQAGRFWTHKGGSANLYNGVYVDEEIDRLATLMEVLHGKE